MTVTRKTALICLMFILKTTTSVYPSPQINFSRLAEIESNNNPNAVSFRGAKHGRGTYQVSEAALADYNRANSAQIAPEDLFCPDTNYKVSKWYFGQIQRYMEYYGIPIKEKYILIAYNWGIGHLTHWYRAGADWSELPVDVKQYLKKYGGE